MLVDTHCHLGDQGFDADRPEVLHRARSAGVEHVVIVAESASASDTAAVLARELGLSATAGVHPHEASSLSSDVLQRIEALLDRPEVVAVGETGLDYHYDHSPRPDQRRSFAAHLELAGRRRLPAVVHARDADDDMADMLRDASAPIVLHSFSSGPKVFRAGIEVNAYFSFSGMVTFKNWKLSESLEGCPPDRLLLETDAPFLAPEPHRGRRNEPAYVRLVAERVAELLGESIDNIALRTTANATRCFGTRVGGVTV